MRYKIGVFKNIVVWVLILTGCFLYGREMAIDNVVVFTEFIEKIENLPVEERQDFINREFEILKEKLEFPVVNAYEVIFVYKGNGANVELMGDMAGWQAFPISLNKVEGTDLFYLRQDYEKDARLDYKFLMSHNTA